MTDHALGRLARAGILEYHRGRAGMTLRASPRFVAHAEDAAIHRGHLGTVGVLSHALATWDGDADLRATAPVLADFLAQREQFGAVRPVFPVLEQYATAGG